MEVADFISDVKNLDRRIEETKREIEQLKGKKGSVYEEEIPDSRTFNARMMDADDTFVAAKRGFQMVLQDSSARRSFETKKEDAVYAHDSIIRSFRKIKDVVEYSRSDGSTAKLDELLFGLQGLERRKTDEELEFIQGVDVDSLTDEEKDELKRSVGKDLKTIRQAAKGNIGKEDDERRRSERNKEYHQDRKKGSLRNVENSIDEVERMIRRGNYLSFEGRDHTDFMDMMGEFFTHVRQYTESDMDLFSAKVTESEKISDFDRAQNVKRADCEKQVEGLIEALDLEKEKSADAFEAGVKKQTKDVTRTSLDDLLELLEGPSQSKGPDKSKDTDKDDKSSKLSIEDLFL